MTREQILMLVLLALKNIKKVIDNLINDLKKEL